jgi:hypothetical protein
MREEVRGKKGRPLGLPGLVEKWRIAVFRTPLGVRGI